MRPQGLGRLRRRGADAPSLPRRPKRTLAGVLSLRMSLRFLRESGGRLVLTVVALALGVALVCAIDLVNRAVLHAFVEVIDTMAGRAALQVTAGENGLFPEDVASAIAGVPGVELAVPVVTATAFTTDDAGELLSVHGIDVTRDAAVRVYEARDAGGLELEDALVFLNQPDSIVLTHAFADRRGLRIGDHVRLMTPTGVRAFTVRGLLEPEGIARLYGGNLVVMDLYAAEAAFTQPGFVNGIDVVVARDANVDQVADAIRRALPQGLRVQPPAQRKADLHAVMQSLGVMLHATAGIGLVAGFLIVFNRLTTVFEARVWQFGVLRATGVRSLALWGELLKEAFFLGAAGVVVGVPLGVAVGRLLLPVIATTAALNFKLIATEVDFTVRGASVGLASLLGIGAALIAAAIPAWRMAHVPVVETIRGRGLEQRGVATRSMRTVRLLVLAGTGAMLALQWATRSPAWGLVATALIAVGTALTAQPLVASVRSALSAALRRFGGPTGRFVAAAFTEHLRRTSLTVAMLGVGLGSILWLETVGYSFEHSLVDALSRALRGDLVVSSAHVASGYMEAPVNDALGAELRAVPGVAEVVGERLIDWQYDGGPIALDAFDPNYFTNPEFGRWPLLRSQHADIWQALSNGVAVLVSSSFELNLGRGVGDHITLETPRGPLTVVIAGVTANFSSPRGTIIMSRALFARFWNDTQVTRVFVRTTPGVALHDVRSAIGRQLGVRHRLRVISPDELLDYFAAQVRRAFAPLDVLAALMLLVILLGIGDTLVSGVLGRTRELGVIRAVGVQRRHLRRLVVAEGLGLGTLGLILAVSAGLFLGSLWVTTTFSYLLGWSLEPYIPYRHVAVISLATITVCLVAALIPARRAAALQPAAALRYE